MERQIDIVEKISNGDGTQLVTAEVNVYSNGATINQLSRTQFLLPEIMTDEEIIIHLKNTDYYRYF